GVFRCAIKRCERWPNKPLFRLIIRYTKAKEFRVEIDGEKRRVYQCELPVGSCGSQLMECDGGKLGLEKGRMYPIVIHWHAMHKLRDRFPAGECSERLIHLGLTESLIEPIIVRRDEENTYWIEFRLYGHKIGYLLARMAQDYLVIITFLFLTMKGTPE